MDRWLSSAHNKQVGTRPDWRLEWSTSGVSSIARAVPLHIHRPGHKLVYAVCMRGKASGRTSIQHYSNPAIWIANINPFFHGNIIPKSIRLRTKELAFKTAKAHHYRQAFTIWLATFLKLAQTDEERIGADLALYGAYFRLRQRSVVDTEVIQKEASGTN